MKFAIKHEIKGRIRIHLAQKHMTYRQADILQCYLEAQTNVTRASIYVRTQDVAVSYTGSREELISLLSRFSYETAQVSETALENSGRELNETYKEKLINSVVLRTLNKMFLPYPVRVVLTTAKSIKYLYHGVRTLLKGKLEVPVLDATAIGVSMIRGDFNTAGSTMFLLGIGEILEEWTHKKSVNDLARSMSINAEKVWLLNAEGQEVLVPVSSIMAGDLVRVHMGNVIPFDGTIVSGEGMVNQASMTGESVPVAKTTDASVFAGTVLEEGELTIRVKQSNGNSKFDQIVSMIEESEKLKSSLEGKAEHLADKLVPYTLLGTGITYLCTKNVTKALSVLMVDFSCALKLAMPISVLSAIKEASTYNITVKGGKYLEAMSEADTIVFDKTGTLTKAQPTVVDVVSFNDMGSDELLRIAACLEEHFPHSMAKAVVTAAKEKNLVHEELHSKVEYIVAHGISSTIEGKSVIIGSSHFVFEDEKCTIPEGKEKLYEQLPGECSHLYMAINRKLAAVVCVEDPLREEAQRVIAELKSKGIKVVMMTGDSDRTARVIASKVGVDEYFSEVLPEDKASFIEKEKADGRKVIMIGDGINDSPALSASDIGIAISDGAEIAREIADVTIGADNLEEIVVLKNLSDRLMERIHNNYRSIVGINTCLIAGGVMGIFTPTTSALLHNTSTLLISLQSMKDLLDK